MKKVSLAVFIWSKLQFKTVFYLNIFLVSDGSYSSLQSHDPSEIILLFWIGPQETFLIIINEENSCAA